MRWRGLALVFCAACLRGAELPEIVARCGERTVGRSEAAALMNGAPAEYAALPRREMLKKLLTERFCAEAMTRMLTDAGFPPSAEQAEKALNDVYRHYPPGMARPDAGDLHRIAQEERTRLQWAFRRYLEARRPEVFQVPPAEVERYYRENQVRFLLPRTVTATEYRAAERMPLETLCARARQGEAPERVLASLPGVTASPAERGAVPDTMRPGEWSAVAAVPGGYAVSHVSAVRPAGYVPLEQAAPLIREMLIRRRTALELERSLRTVLASEKMEFYF